MERNTFILSIIGAVALEHPRITRTDLRLIQAELHYHLPPIEALADGGSISRTDVEEFITQGIFDVRTYTIISMAINKEIKNHGKGKKAKK
jgi:hypothetical protein